MSPLPKYNLDPSHGIHIGAVDKHVDVTCGLLCHVLFADGDDWLRVAAAAVRTPYKDRCSSAVRGRNASKHRTWIGKRCSVAIEAKLLACDDDTPPLRSGDDADDGSLLNRRVIKKMHFLVRGDTGPLRANFASSSVVDSCV